MSFTSQKIQAAFLAITGLFVVAELYISIPIMGLFAEKFHISLSETLWITSAFGLAYASGFLFFGPLSDKYGQKNLLAFGLFGLFISTLFVALSSSFPEIITARVFQGFLAATFAPAALSYINEKTDISIRATSIAWISCGFMLAGIAGQIYSEEMARHFQWPWIFGIVSIAYLIFSLVLSCLLTSSEKKDTEKLIFIYKKMVQHFFSKTLFPLYLISFFLLLSFVAFYSSLGIYLTNTYALSHQDIFYVRAAGIPGMLTALFIGKYIKKYGASKVIIKGIFLVVVGLIGSYLFENLINLIVMSILFVTGISITAPALIAAVGQSAETAKGAAISLYTFILFIGASAGPFFYHILGNNTLNLWLSSFLLGTVGIFSLFKKYSGAK